MLIYNQKQNISVFYLLICYKISAFEAPKHLATGFCEVLYKIFIKLDFFVNIFSLTCFSPSTR